MALTPHNDPNVGRHIHYVDGSLSLAFWILVEPPRVSRRWTSLPAALRRIVRLLTPRTQPKRWRPWTIAIRDRSRSCFGRACFELSDVQPCIAGLKPLWLGKPAISRV